MHRPINPEAVPPPLGGYAQTLEVRPGLRWVQISGREHALVNSRVRQHRLQGVTPALTVVVAQTLDPRWLLEVEAVAAAPL